MALFFLSAVIAVILELFRKPENMLISTHLDVVMRSAGLQFSQSLFNLVCLPYEACFSFDAMVRTCWRMMISHKGLLQWSASGDANRSDTGDLSSSFKIMASAPIIACITGGYLSYAQPSSLPVALPILFLWLISPFVAWWLSQPIVSKKAS